MESIRKTRYPELGYTQDGPGLWRIVDLTDGPRPDGLFPRVGPQYRTKTELLSDLDRYARNFGCLS